MALTWATGVRFGRATRRIERGNELHLATNSLRRFGSSFGPKNAYFHELFYVLCFLVGFFELLFCSSFRPKCVLGPFSNFGLYLYVAKANEKLRLEF
ncbi:hypothetical protein Hanom_Chr12g01138541 [Helianthus anomalus]